MNRRDFLKTVGLGSASLALGRCVGRCAQVGEKLTPVRKPNILVIMSDEHNAGVLGCYGNRIIATPNLDKLAAAGTLLQNCYCNSPLCVPSRLAFTSGKYASRVGAWNNSCWLPSADYPSLPRIMNAAGYESVLCGKMHYDSTCRYGFREIGGNMNNAFMTGRDSNRRRPDDLTPKPGISERFNDFHAGDKSSILNHDRKVTAGTVDFLEHRKAGDKPFFLFTGYLAPHFPLIVPQEYWDHYKGKVPMPVIPEGHLASLPRNYKHLRIGFNIEDVPDDVVRKGRELYYGLTQWLDNEVGKVLTTLARSDVADNTVVIYTADHGENMGEHGLWWKNAMFEHAARVPLIVSWPARWKGGQRRLGACSLVDVVQTIAQIGGAEVPKDWNGDSMVKWLDGPQARWKDKAVSEYYAHNIASGYAMIRMGRFKYVYHTPADASHPAQRELYDLEADPGEFHNLAGDPSHKDRVEKMHAALVAEIGEDPDKTELRCRSDCRRGYRRQGQKGKNQLSDE
jgi:choline-sulfatase